MGRHPKHYRQTDACHCFTKTGLKSQETAPLLLPFSGDLCFLYLLCQDASTLIPPPPLGFVGTRPKPDGWVPTGTAEEGFWRVGAPGGCCKNEDLEWRKGAGQLAASGWVFPNIVNIGSIWGKHLKDWSYRLWCKNNLSYRSWWMICYCACLWIRNILANPEPKAGPMSGRDPMTDQTWGNLMLEFCGTHGATSRWRGHSKYDKYGFIWIYLDLIRSGPIFERLPLRNISTWTSR